MASDIISNDMIMTTDNPPSTDDDRLSTLPLGLLLGRISGVFRTRLLEACQDIDSDVRLIGLALAIKGNPGFTQADHARFLGIDLNTASRLVNRAEELRILRRAQSALDRRAFTLELTAAGEMLATRGAEAIDRLEKDLKEAVGESEFDAFRRTAEQILCYLG